MSSTMGSDAMFAIRSVLPFAQESQGKSTLISNADRPTAKIIQT
ncbi:hypothetical protein [Leptolyngbya ohadii]|nr:hypothetical protein [Leptolyngbya ohadii]